MHSTKALIFGVQSVRQAKSLRPVGLFNRCMIFRILRPLYRLHLSLPYLTRALSGGRTAVIAGRDRSLPTRVMLPAKTPPATEKRSTK